MEEIHISKIPYEVAGATFFKVPIHKEISFGPFLPGTVDNDSEIEIKTYRIVRGRKPCQLNITTPPPPVLRHANG